MSTMQSSNTKPVRLGFVGLGARGTYHLKAALMVQGVEVAALCDVDTARLEQAAGLVRGAGKAASKRYGKGEKDYERMCGEETLDAVICSTPPQSHAAVCLAANRNGKHAASEGPLALTLENAWALIEAYEKTKKWSALALETTLLEEENGNNLTLLNLVRNGLLGDMIHCEDGVLRDRRAAKLREMQRSSTALGDSGNFAPDAPMNRLIPLMDINHGDRFDSLMSVSSRPAAMAEFASTKLGKEAAAKFRNGPGDYNASILHTVDGKLVTLNYDTSTPNPREYCRFQGTKGVYMSAPGLPGPMIYIDGISVRPHRWEKVDSYFEQHRHPLLGKAAGNKTPLTWQLLVAALREGKQPYFDVYDSVTSSAVIALTQKSVSSRSRPVEFPDFTRGQWKTRKPIDLLTV
ncbi:MAG TPA: Gfo/Idh/MocA family oxidoreductase [Bryobacteraceae bacterium]|nr:Gfo/Idh/MocA family oxidoreductase [Bryobacteraceae bacterium]